ncbi:BsuPI-related putative proteinase inhibitor [Alteribacillus sp. YIM 98480]|uniref:BsuPI-related putative proteinase inhibitor n=1 Tax=Alteribacillus sp. YIM 98480 TaxID=2606599 RepID=UPI00131D6EC3|nr:BsuPI-related putative proteinase inhibitor [Alteribacillus sp. YIM 98480]
MNKPLFFMVVFFLTFSGAACATSEEDGTGGETEKSMGENWKLTGEFDVDSDSWRMELENISEHPLELQFNSGQEIEVDMKKDGQSESVYQYSADKMFTQALKQTTIEPGASTTWSDDISQKSLEKGSYTVIFEVLARKVNGEKPEKPLKTSDTFTIK